MLPEVQTRVETLSEVPGYVDFLFVDEPEIDEKAWNKAMVPDAAGWLDAVIAAAERVAVAGRGAARAVHGARRGAGCQPSEVPGAGPGRADRSLRWGRRCSSRWWCWGSDEVLWHACGRLGSASAAGG